MAPKREKAGRRQQTEAVAQGMRGRPGRAGDRAPETTTRVRGLARRTRGPSAERVQAFGVQARDPVDQAREAVDTIRNRRPESDSYLVSRLERPITPLIKSDSVRAATYELHRGQGANGRATPEAARLESDHLAVVATQLKEEESA